MESNLDKAINKSKKETKRLKNLYDRYTRKSNIEQGETVLLHVAQQERGTLKKLNRKWKGPEEVGRRFLRIEEVLYESRQIFYRW